MVRQERPHPGGQLTLFDTIEGRRHQVIATDTPPGRGNIQYVEARHRAHARVEDRIRCGASAGSRPASPRSTKAWLHLALTGIDLIAWTPTLLLDGARPRRTQDDSLPAATRRRANHPHRPNDPAGEQSRAWRKTEARVS